MRLLRTAVENQRWDLAAHIIVLATARLLKNGDKPGAGQRAAGNPSLRIAGGSGAGSVANGGRDFERKKGGARR